MDPFIGEIRLFAGTYAPAGWAYCNGDVLQVYQNQALYSIIGNRYGGTAPNTFALPNLNNGFNAPMGKGQGPGLTNRPIGSTGGEKTVTLTINQIANHNHQAMANTTTASVATPVNGDWANQKTRPAVNIYSKNADTPMSPLAIGATGNDMAHNNVQPSLDMAYIIALDGIYPVKPA